MDWIEDGDCSRFGVDRFGCGCEKISTGTEVLGTWMTEVQTDMVCRLDWPLHSVDMSAFEDCWELVLGRELIGDLDYMGLP